MLIILCEQIYNYYININNQLVTRVSNIQLIFDFDTYYPVKHFFKT